MFGKNKKVLEMPADFAASAGGAMEYAGFWRRVAALFVDNAIITLGAIVLAIVLGMVMGPAGAALAYVVYMLAGLLYWPVLESSARQATFGKQLLGLQVTDLDGNRLSFVKALLRHLAKIISSIPFSIGFLIAAFTARKQALHDIITKCLVVRSGPSSFIKALVAAVGGLLIAGAAGGYYVWNMVSSQMETAMKDAMKDAKKAPPPVAKSAPSKPAVTRAPEPAAPPKPAADKPASVEVKPSADKPAMVEVKPAPAKPEAAPIKPATVEIKPTPAPEKPASVALAPAKPAAEIAPMTEAKPAPRRRAAPRKPAVPPADVAPATPPVVKTPSYNDVMTPVMRRDPAGVQEAIDAGFWADRADSHGVTPLMVAAQNGDLPMVQLLLKNGASPNRSSPAGSVLDYANRGGNGNVIAALKKAGAR